MANDPNVRPIPDEYFEMFRTALGLSENAVESELPDTMRVSFWKLKATFDRVNYSIEPTHIALLVTFGELMGVVGSVGPKKTFLTEINAGRVKYDDAVEALHQNQWCLGLFRSHTGGGEVMVEIKGNEYRFAAENVRWPQSTREREKTNAVRRGAA